MSITVDGSSIVFDGTVTITNFNNTTGNGVCTLTLTPSGGVGSLPFMAPGTPGLPPSLTLGTVNTLSPGQAATAALIQTSAGGSGTASAYTLNLGLPQGATGATGSINIGSAIDLSGTPNAGQIINVASVSSGTPTFNYVNFPFVKVYNATSFGNISTSGANNNTYATIAIPAQDAAWTPFCFGGATGVGTANTSFSLQALITAGSVSNQAVAGDVGSGATATERLYFIPNTTLSVPAGTTATITAQINQLAAVTDLWSCPSASQSFMVACVPVSF